MEQQNQTAPSVPLTLKDVEKHIKIWTTIISVVVSICGGLLIVAGFYYKTNFDIESIRETSMSNAQQISDLTKIVNTLSTQTAVNAAGPISLGKEIEEINKRLDRLELKQDKSYDLILELSKK